MTENKINKSDLLQIIIAFAFIAFATYLSYRLAIKEEKAHRQLNTIEESISQIQLQQEKTSFFCKEPEEGLMDALIFYDIKHPEIVYSQAILESGLGKSKVYKNTNNLFGLYNSKYKKYHEFDHWSQSVVGYKNMIQKRYKQNECYYAFLQRIGYAEDPNYITKLKNIHNKTFNL